MVSWREIEVSFVKPWGHNFGPVGGADRSSGSEYDNECDTGKPNNDD